MSKKTKPKRARKVIQIKAGVAENRKLDGINQPLLNAALRVWEAKQQQAGRRYTNHLQEHRPNKKAA